MKQFKKQNRSISQRLRKTRKKEILQEIVEDWSNAWQTEQSGLIDRLGSAIEKDDFDEQCITLGELRAVTNKRFIGLKNAWKEIIERIDDQTDDPDTGRD